jgi:ABC-type uncharacterized transport system permease subunit
MEQAPVRPAELSIGDAVAFGCAAILGLIFLFLPWFNIGGQAYTGLKLLSTSGPAVQSFITGIILIPIATVLGITAGLWGLINPRARKLSVVGTTLAGIFGLLYFVVFLFLNNQVDPAGLFGGAFGIALLMVVGLLVQPALPRPLVPGQYRFSDYITITRVGIFSLLFIALGIWILLSTASAISGDVTTLLTVDTGGTVGITVPTLGFALIVALLYIAGGVIGIVPNPKFRRIRGWWLIVNGIVFIPTVLVLIAAGGKTNITVMLQASLRLSTPIIMGAMAGLWCERSGVTNIAIEGMMLTGACIGFVTFTILNTNGQMSTPQAQFVGVIVAVFAGMMMSALHAWLSLNFKTNQIISGTVINILAIGLTSFLRRDVLVNASTARSTLPILAIPGLSRIPILGDVLFSGQPIFYSMFIIVMVTHLVMYYTRWGLRTRAVGENPHAADTLGINVHRNRWINVLIGGMIAGLAGAWYSLETTGVFDDNMTSGQGFIALAAMIFGNWTPIGGAVGGLLFGFSVALGQRFQILGVPIPSQFLNMVPYIVTIVVLAGLIGKSQPPKADGIPYEKE